MSTTGLEVFDSTVQKTNRWLGDVMEALGWQDRQPTLPVGQPCTRCETASP